MNIAFTSYSLSSLIDYLIPDHISHPPPMQTKMLPYRPCIHRQSVSVCSLSPTASKGARHQEGCFAGPMVPYRWSNFCRRSIVWLYSQMVVHIHQVHLVDLTASCTFRSLTSSFYKASQSSLNHKAVQGQKIWLCRRTMYMTYDSKQCTLYILIVHCTS